MPFTMPLTLRNKLKTLCSSSSSVDAWSYAIFWRFHPRNSLLLTVEEAYYEENQEEEISNMHPPVHLLGEGIVGEAAFTGKHSWVHSDGQTHYWNPTGQNICEDDSCLHQQFSSGIKTIVVIPIKALGVIQFGSRNKILERVEFLEQTQSMLTEIDDYMGMFDMLENAVLPLDYDTNELNGMLASISSASPNHPFPSHYKNYEEPMASFQADSSYLGDQLKGIMEAQVVLSDRNNTDVLLRPNSSTDNLIATNPYLGVCDGELSSFDLLEQQLVSSARPQDVADACFMNENAFPTSKVPVQDSALVPLCSMHKGSFQGKLYNSLDNQCSNQSSVVTDVDFSSSSYALRGHSESIEPVDMSEEILKFSSMDDLCHWFGPSSEDSICKAVIALDNNFSESTEFNPTSFDLVGSSSLNDVLVTGLAGYNSNTDGNETSVIMQNTEKGPLDFMEIDFSYEQVDEWWGNTLTPVVSGVTETGFSECISELNSDSLPGTRKRLFSELGIEELLRGGANYNPINSSEFECGLSPNKRQTVVESSSVNGSTIAELMQPLCDLDSTNNLLSKKDTFSKLQAATWVDDSHSINIRKSVQQHPQKPEEPKPTKKRARPGESPRPRPKDRQQIQDCIKELRGIIPNGGKCSIDSLLDRTIRYMLFLQSVLKYSDKLREPSEPKLIERENEVVLEDSGVADSKNCGITWAYEVGHETMLCPIIVEDTSPPGQMLIEMLCEVQGIFLEIIDVIRGFGLNILKAKMERKKNKLWARFIVEANRHVTRIDVFWSLIHLLQQTNTSGIDSSNKNWDAALHANSIKS
ncbi:transcription factor bHLH157-like isoform X2 [Vigna unguiculata]|uniref:Transcription factor MYC/MYB N-terminal n=1 Tax=Vigna unguiculata TaxID=3917 RepID=A0A4D6N1S3_VIGUN|nr:transcription factor bHLH157-like isoform X2 [Vigna unguiculata]QCE07726.1 Transcription factor MYC/MYB N-terminal [Vigna unguiculata]